MSSSRPVNETGWNETKLILSQFSTANFTIGPTWSSLIVLTIVDDEADVDARGVEVLDRAQLHVEQVADLAVRVGVLADAVELQVGDAQARPRAPAVRELGVLREADAVGRRLHAEIADLCARSATASRKIGEIVGSPPENCTVIWRRGLIVIASSSSFFTSSNVSSCT